MRLKDGTKMITGSLGFRVGMSLAFGLIWTSAVLGDGPLFPGAQYAAGDGPRSVAIGDLDGDRLPDLGVANLGSGNVSVLLNQLGECNGNGIPDECEVDCGRRVVRATSPAAG